MGNGIDELYRSEWDPHSKVQEIRKILKGMNMNGTANYGLTDQNNINIINTMRSNTGEGRGSEEWLDEMLKYAKQLKPEANKGTGQANSDIKRMQEAYMLDQYLNGNNEWYVMPNFQAQAGQQNAQGNGSGNGAGNAAGNGQAAAPAGQTGQAQTTAQAVANATQGAVNPGGNASSGYQEYNKPENKGLYSGVSDETKKMLEKYQAGYQQSDIVTQAQEQLKAIQNAKPQSYESKYGEQLDALLQQIMNPEKFNYEFNGDNLFKAYADMYEQQAQQANLNAQGAAAAMTGGYGNSYAESVGNQAYQQQMTQLYDKGQQFRDTAYQAYQDELAQKQNQYNILNAEEQAEYGRYRDLYEDWAKQEEMAYNREYNERQMDYNKYIDQLNYYTGLAQIENQAYTSEEARQEAIRQFTLNYNESLREYEKNFEENARQFDLNLQLGYDTLTSNENIAAGHDAASIASSQISAGASMYAADRQAEGREAELALQREKMAADQEQREWERGRTEAQDQAAQEQRDWERQRTEEQDQRAQEQADQAEAERARALAESKVLAALQAKHQPSKATMEAAGWTQEDVDAVLGKPAAGGGAAAPRVLVRGNDGNYYYRTTAGSYVKVTPTARDRIDTSYVYPVVPDFGSTIHG